MKLLKLTLKENKTGSDNPIEPPSKFSFDNEEDYSGKFMDINQYVSSTYSRNNMPMDMTCKEHIERIIEGELCDFNKYRAVHSEDILQKIATQMKLELDLTGSIICVIFAL